MKAFIAALGVWTAAVLGVLFYNPFQVWYPMPCGRIVGRSAACQAAMDAANDLIRWFSIYPMLAFMLAGYLAIVLIAFRGRRRRARSQSAARDAGERR